jgi:hypothetical protein
LVKDFGADFKFGTPAFDTGIFGLVMLTAVGLAANRANPIIQ